MFEHVDFYAGDPILSLNETFAKDDRKDKVNLGIGVYYTEEGKVPVLECVRKVEEEMLKKNAPHTYLSMEGLPDYRKAVQEILFGKDNPVLKEDRIATVQTLGGSGALKLGSEFLHRYFPKSKCHVSKPTWGNHIGIFEGSGIEVAEYPYYDAKTGGVLFQEMLDYLGKLPEGDIVLLHPCCHNPTGVDLSKEQWDKVLDLVKQKKLIAFMDIAYQGLGDGMEEDAYAVRKALSMGLNFFVSNSYSKNLSLYGERVGGLSVVCPNSKEKELVFGQLKFAVRRIYSSPPFHGGHIVAGVMSNPEYFKMWLGEVEEMRQRIMKMRGKLEEVLTAKLPGRDFSYFTKQRGMFSFTGLTPDQVEKLKADHAIYLVKSGRMCVAGLNGKNVEQIANAFAEVMK